MTDEASVAGYHPNLAMNELLSMELPYVSTVIHIHGLPWMYDETSNVYQSTE